MAILQVRDIDDRLYDALKARAKRDHRSLSQEVIHMIENYLQRSSGDTLSQTKQFLNLSGAFEETTAEELLRTIRKSRKDSKRFEGERGLFD